MFVYKLLAGTLSVHELFMNMAFINMFTFTFIYNTPHLRRLLHKVHLPFRGAWPRASPRATKKNGPQLETYR